MDRFESLVARKWASHFLYYHDIGERLANAVPESAMASSLELGEGRQSRSLGEVFLELAHTVLFFTGTTVEIAPGTGSIGKDEVLKLMRRARGAMWHHARRLTNDDVGAARRTVLDANDSTWVESVVVLLANYNRRLGEALLLANAAGITFDMHKPAQYPSPFTPGPDAPGPFLDQAE